MKVKVLKVAELKQLKQNIRKHTDKQINEYIRSIEMFGQIRPIIVDENYEILAGNGLHMALTKMGRETCDCYVMENLDEKTKKKLMLADNRVYELGITDVDVFDDIIRDLNGDVDVPGWDEDLLKLMNASAVDVTDELESYGKYEETELNKLSQAPAQATPIVHPAPMATPIQSMPISSAVEEVKGEVQNEGRFVICPSCGEKIWL